MLRPYISELLGLGSYAAQPVAQPRFQLLRFVPELQGLADRADVLKHLVERVRVQRDDPRGGHESRDDTRQLAFAHGADVAHRLRSEEHTSELQSRLHLVCRLLLEKKKNNNK